MYSLKEYTVIEYLKIYTVKWWTKNKDQKRCVRVTHMEMVGRDSKRVSSRRNTGAKTHALV